MSVADTGKGISAENLGKLFKPFGQLSDKRDNPEGTGLGLVICKSLCEKMGGTIRVSSVLGQGTTFTVRLPATLTPVPLESLTPAPSPQPRPAPPPATVHAERAFTVLVVDDDPQVGELMRRFLEKEGFDIHVALSGVQALEAVKALRPDVITLDVLMPGIDGWSVLAALKNDHEVADIPVIILSIVDDRSKGFMLGTTNTSSNRWTGSVWQASCLNTGHARAAAFSSWTTMPTGATCAGALSSKAAGRSWRPMTARAPYAASSSTGPP